MSHQVIRFWMRSHASGGDGVNQQWKTGVAVKDGNRWMHVLVVDDSKVHIERIDPAENPYSVIGEVTAKTVASIVAGCAVRSVNEDAAQYIDGLVLSHS